MKTSADDVVHDAHELWYNWFVDTNAATGIIVLSTTIFESFMIKGTSLD